MTLMLACAPLAAAAEPATLLPELVLEAPPRPLLDRVTASVTGIFTVRAALKDTLVGGGPDIRLGIENRWRGMALHLAYERGEVGIGLPYEVLVGGPEFWWRPRHWASLGGGLDLGALSVERVTRTDHLWTLFVGAHATAELQLARRTWAVAPVLLFRLALELLTDAPGVTAASVSGTVGLGLRLGGARWQ